MLDAAREQLAQLGAELRRARVQDARSQADVGEQAGLSRQLVHRIEAGISGGIAAYLAVAGALNRRIALIEATSGKDLAAPGLVGIEINRGDDNKHLKILLDNLFSYVALLDIDGIVQEVNQAPLVRAGYRYEDVIGQYFHDAPWWSYDKSVQSQLKGAIESARHGKKVDTT